MYRPHLETTFINLKKQLSNMRNEYEKLYEFSIHSKENAMRSQPDISPTVKLYLKNRNFEMIGKILDNFKNTNLELLNDTAQRTLNRLRNVTDSQEWNISAETALYYRHISKQEWEQNGKCRVFFKPRIDAELLSEDSLYFEIEFQLQGAKDAMLANSKKIESVLREGIFNVSFRACVGVSPDRRVISSSDVSNLIVWS